MKNLRSALNANAVADLYGTTCPRALYVRAVDAPRVHGRGRRPAAMPAGAVLVGRYREGVDGAVVVDDIRATIGNPAPEDRAPETKKRSGVRRTYSPDTAKLAKALLTFFWRRPLDPVTVWWMPHEHRFAMRADPAYGLRNLARAVKVGEFCKGFGAGQLEAAVRRAVDGVGA